MGIQLLNEKDNHENLFPLYYPKSRDDELTQGKRDLYTSLLKQVSRDMRQ